MLDALFPALSAIELTPIATPPSTVVSESLPIATA